MILIDGWRARKRRNPEDLKAWVCYNFHVQYCLVIHKRKGISYPVYKAIKKKGYQVPTPIQRRFAIAHTCSPSKLTYLPIRCIPLIMDGKDVVAMARTGLLDSGHVLEAHAITGSGKTAAFLVPMLERLKTHSAKVCHPTPYC